MTTTTDGSRSRLLLYAYKFMFRVAERVTKGHTHELMLQDNRLKREVNDVGGKLAEEIPNQICSV
ncbi:hypothetical protein OUZ56_022413 [Daphnia magna]|uniref:Uncharacterized protein n=1 Tax=Daphnia magna TaxID=35525 RepID=A0ABR0AWB0_9CRUS|nr:hypothetical protein OUZ56_022413 [Daphnia magna]